MDFHCDSRISNAADFYNILLSKIRTKKYIEQHEQTSKLIGKPIYHHVLSGQVQRRSVINPKVGIGKQMIYKFIIL